MGHPGKMLWYHSGPSLAVPGHRGIGEDPAPWIDLKQFIVVPRLLTRIERPWIVLTKLRFQGSGAGRRLRWTMSAGSRMSLARAAIRTRRNPVVLTTPPSLRSRRHLDTQRSADLNVHTRLPRVQCRVHGVLSIASECEREPGSGRDHRAYGGPRSSHSWITRSAALQAVEPASPKAQLPRSLFERPGRRRSFRGQRSRKVWKVPVHLGVQTRRHFVQAAIPVT